MDEIEKKKNRLSYIFSKKVREQARLLRQAKTERNKWQKIELTTQQYGYLFDFFKKHSLLVIGLLMLLFSQGVIESALVIFSRDQLSTEGRTWIVHNFLFTFSGLIIVFLINSFFSIKYEKSLLVIFANGIRRRLFKSYIERSVEHSSSEEQANIVAKLSYHLPLVSLGVSNTFFGVWRWLLYSGIVLVISYIGGYHIVIVSGCFLLISASLFFGAYFLSRFYVSQEVTFYSKIIKEVDFNASNIDFLKTFGQEAKALSKFDTLVWFDSFFRVRRDILMKIGFKVVFVLLILVSILSHFFSTSFFSFIGSTNAAEKFILLFLLIYFSRALSEAVKIGLYLFPARLGLFLTILPPGTKSIKDVNVNIKNKIITFYSYKTKLFKEGGYHRNLKFVFEPGQRVLVYGDNLSGKTALAKLFTGILAYNPRAVKVTLNKERLEFPGWQNRCLGAYFFDPNFRSDRSLMECMVGKVKEDITIQEFEETIRVINRYPSIVDLVSGDGNYNMSADRVLNNPVQAFALHALHCIATGCYFMVIDNFWLDLQYPRIIEMIQILDTALPTSIMIVFSRTDNEYVVYNSRYEINKKIKYVR